MASKAAQAELARKRCTPSSGVLVLPNTEVDSVAEVVEPSRDTHGYWPQKGASPFPKKGRLKAPADIHPGTQKQELEPKIEPNISQPCQRQRMWSRDDNKRIKKRLHQLYQAMSNHVSNSIDLCRWSQPDTLRLVLWNHCPSQPKGSLMAQAHWPQRPIHPEHTRSHISVICGRRKASENGLKIAVILYGMHTKLHYATLQVASIDKRQILQTSNSSQGIKTNPCNYRNNQQRQAVQDTLAQTFQDR